MTSRQQPVQNATHRLFKRSNKILNHVIHGSAFGILARSHAERGTRSDRYVRVRDILPVKQQSWHISLVTNSYSDNRIYCYTKGSNAQY